MQFFVFAVALLVTHDFTGAVPERTDKCASRCDVSMCASPSCPGGYVPDRCHCCLVCSPGEGDPCGRKNDLPCGDGLECKMGKRRGGKGICRCEADHEVCGGDGRTYGNLCKMRAASSKALQRGRPAVTQAHKGPCSALGAGRTPPGAWTVCGKRAKHHKICLILYPQFIFTYFPT